MTIYQQYLDLMLGIDEHIDVPGIAGLYLPPVNSVHCKKDDFGFVFLEDGNAGPFYTSLTGSLQQLWQKFPCPTATTMNTMEVIQAFTGTEQANRALALGAINAVSQHLMKRSGFNVMSCSDENSGSLGVCNPQPGEMVGMVGYFSPLVEKLRQQQIEVMVIEKIPARVEPEAGVYLGKNISALKDCSHVICTASTLINQTLETVLAQAGQAKTFNILGPSGSHCPDVLFNLGVTSVGGIQFNDIFALKAALRENESWGKLGKKYQLQADCYPGLKEILASCH